MSKHQNSALTSSFGNVRKSGENLKKILAPSFSKPATTGRSMDLASIESEYIKNLQQQVYFLELEANFLRDQAKKSTEMQPRLADEADRMLRKIRELEKQGDNLTEELRRKESNVEIVENEKTRMMSRVHASEDCHARDKKILVEEIVQLKKQLEGQHHDCERKDRQLSNLRDDFDKSNLERLTQESRIQALQREVDTKCDLLKSSNLALEEKRAEMLRTQTDLRNIEEKYFASAASLQEQATKDLRDEIRIVRQQLKEAEMKADQDRYLRTKLTDESSHLVRENATLGSQVIEFQKLLERERSLREDNVSRHTLNTAEFLRARDNEKKQEFELRQMKDLLDLEARRVKDLSDKLNRTEQESTSSRLATSTAHSRLSELEAHHSGTDSENTQLRRDKLLLIDHVSELQNQVQDKESEINNLRSNQLRMEGNMASLEKQVGLESLIQQKKWNEMELVANSMKNVSQSMRDRTLSPRYTDAS